MTKELKPCLSTVGTSLAPWTFNARRWREENGYITPEWEMYVGNMICTMIVLCSLSLVLGVLIGQAI